MGVGHLNGGLPVADPSAAAGCRGAPGRVRPSIDRNRCEAKEACIAVCPYRVLEIRPLEAADRAGLSWRGRARAWAHGGRQAYAVRPADCRACGECVKACPEDAIRLVAAERS